MAAIARLLGISAGSPPPRIESDDVYPVHMLDDVKALRGIVVAWTLRFDDVLDPDKLHESLSKLLEKGDWRKVGGRLRLKENGKLEIHVPQQFTADRPAVSYSHQSLNMDIENHALARTLPSATDGPSIQAGAQNFRAFAAKENAPETLEDFLINDTPQLSLHITSFTNATLIGLSWPHTLMDVMGQQALLRGWSLILAGRESEVPPMLGAKEDAISGAADSPDGVEEEFKMGQAQLKGWGMLIFGLRFAWDLFWNRSVDTRTIFLPRKTVTELCLQARNDLAAQNGGETMSFISEGDVLTAWAIRVVASSLPHPRPVTALHALNARFRLSSLFQASGVYVQNMAVAAFAFISPELARGALGPIALENRRSLGEQATESQVLAGLREMRKQSKLGRDPTLICGESGALLMPFTNWSKAALFQAVDFSPALTCTGNTGLRGKLVYHHASSMRQNPLMRNVIVVLGSDLHDNTWITATLLPQTWTKMEEALRTV